MQTHSFGHYNGQNNNQSINLHNNNLSANFNCTLKKQINLNSNDLDCNQDFGSGNYQEDILFSPKANIINQTLQDPLNMYLTNHSIRKSTGNYMSKKRQSHAVVGIQSSLMKSHINLLNDDDFDHYDDEDDIEIVNQRKLQVQAVQPPETVQPIVDCFNDKPLQINQNTAVKQKKQDLFQDYQDNNNTTQNINNNLATNSSQMNHSYNEESSINSGHHNQPMPIQINNNMLKGSSELYVWGRNQNGQLGIEPSMKSVIKIPHLLKLNIMVTEISCGKSHTALITNDGELYSMGSNQKGQLGIGQQNVKYLSSPELVEALSMYKAKKICCSRNATFALMSAQEINQDSGDILFSWGSEKEGVLGIGQVDSGSQYFPIKVMIDEENDEQLEILDLSAGKAHVGVVLKRKNDDNGINSLYMWGSNKYGQLGLWDFENRNTPAFLDVEFNPVSVCCGDTFSIVQTQQSTIYSSGSNLQGQLGQSQTVNKVSVFSQITNISLKPDVFISKISASDFSSCLLSNGEMYIWGPTPIGQFNSPQMLQDLIQNNIGIKGMSMGTSFGLIQDQNNLTYQIGSLFQEAKNNTNFQYLDNMNFQVFTCGHDFVVASSANQQYHSTQPKQRQSMKMNRSNTQSLIQYQKNIVKKRQPSDHHLYNKVHLNNLQQSQTSASINNQMNMSIAQFNINNLNANHQQQQQMMQQQQQKNFDHMQLANQQQLFMNHQVSNNTNNNHSLSPLRISNINPTLNHNFDTSTLNASAILNTTTGGNMNYIQPNPYNRYSNVHQSVNHANGFANILNNPQLQSTQQRRDNKRQHLDSCTPVRRDLTPTQLESNSNTPNNMKLRIQNQNTTNNNNNNNHQQLANVQLNHMQSYAASNTDDLLSQTLVNTPQQLRRTFAGQPQHSLMSHQNTLNHHHQSTTSPYGNTPGPCPCNNPMCNNGANQFGMVSGFNQNPMIFQSIDQQQPSYVNYHNTSNMHHQQSQIDFLIKEKQEIHHQLNVEIQRRLLQEKELNEAYKKLDGINNQHQQNIHELTQMLDLTKRDNDSLMNQLEEFEQDAQALKDANQALQDELSSYKAMYEDLQSKQQTIVRENEYLKNRVELTQQMQVSQGTSGGVSQEKVKEIEDQLAKKNKEIYELTVQLGCLKEENNQLKKDNEEMNEDFQERLQNQQIRAEADFMVVNDENEKLRSTIEQLKVIREEVQQLKVIQEEKNAKMEDMQNLIDKLQEEIEIKDENEKIQQQEIQILHQEQDKLLKELKKLQSQTKLTPKITQSINQKNLLLSTTLPDDSDCGGYDLDDLRRAADDIMREQQHYAFKSNLTPISKSGNMASIMINLDHSHHSQPPQDTQNDCINLKTQIINPIETPIESHRNSSFYQPVISAHSNGQNYMQSHFRPSNERNHYSNLTNSQSMHQNQMQNTLTPKELMYQKLKQSMISGKDSRSTTNREQGCLQVSNLQRRKSTQGGTATATTTTYSQQVKNLRSSKSGGNMKFKATTSRSNNISKVAQAQANDQNVHPDNHHSANCQPSSTTQNKQANQYHQQRASIQNMPSGQKSPIAFTKKRSVNNLMMPNQKQIEVIDHPLDTLCHTVFVDQTNKSPMKHMSNQSYTTTNSQLASKNFNQLNQMLGGGNKHDNHLTKSHHSNIENSNQHQSLSDTISAHITGKVISGGGKVGQVHTPKQNTRSGGLNKDNSKGSLFDMKHKLQDIQHNKQYLEKKIYEYEKKLNELKGTSTQNVQGVSSALNLDINAKITQSFYNANGSNTKLNTLTGSLIEKVFK